MTPEKEIDIARFKHWTNDHIRFSDLDPFGHVNNKSIAAYFENARIIFATTILGGAPWKKPCTFLLAHSSIDFLNELHLPSSIRIGNRVVKIGRTSLAMEGVLCRAGTIIAATKTTSVYIDQKTRRPTPIPDDLREKLMEFYSE